jgi:hypothetical protein
MADPSRDSFLFTLENPHDFPATKFALTDDGEGEAIFCRSRRGPCFGDLSVSDNCNASTDSSGHLGGSYANDTGLDGRTVLTGSCMFTVSEIEVFEITD